MMTLSGEGFGGVRSKLGKDLNLSPEDSLHRFARKAILPLLLVGLVAVFLIARQTRHAPEPAREVSRLRRPPWPRSLPRPQHRERARSPIPAITSISLSAAGKKSSRNPTGVVVPDVAGEVEALRLYEETIHKHPGWTSDQVDDELVRVIYTEKRRKRLIEVYQWVTKALERFIDRQPAHVFSNRQKNQLDTASAPPSWSCRRRQVCTPASSISSPRTMSTMRRFPAGAGWCGWAALICSP